MEINFFMNSGINPSFNGGVKPLKPQEVREVKEAPQQPKETTGGFGKAFGSLWSPIANFMEADVDDLTIGSPADLKQSSDPALGKKLNIFM